MADAATAPPPPASEAKQWAGRPVDDLDSVTVGQVHGLFVDADSGEPSWLIVRQGRVRGTVVAVPMRDCAAAAERVWVAHERDAIRHAPVVDPTRPLLREHELAIGAHYGIGEGVGRPAEVAPRKNGAITSVPWLERA